jgi:AcrR family transcriptional regulator
MKGAMNDTRQRLVTVSADLFQRQGLTGTGIKQILAESNARFSSLYHHFPGGKDELAAEVVRISGARYQQLVEAVWDSAPDLIHSVIEVFDGAAQTLEATDFAVACPIATVALEVASTNEGLREVTAEVFGAWISSGTKRLVGAGMDPEKARLVALSLISLLEGAFMLCQAAKSTEPMIAARSAAVMIVNDALATEGRA